MLCVLFCFVLLLFVMISIPIIVVIMCVQYNTFVTDFVLRRSLVTYSSTVVLRNGEEKR